MLHHIRLLSKEKNTYEFKIDTWNINQYDLNL